MPSGLHYFCNSNNNYNKNKHISSIENLNNCSNSVELSSVDNSYIKRLVE